MQRGKVIVVEAGKTKLPEYRICRAVSPVRCPDGWAPECSLELEHRGQHLCKVEGGSIKWGFLGRELVV